MNDNSDIHSILYPVAERFISINGEGVRAGQLSGFIRMKGCNLSCSYCDTSWANAADCPCEYLGITDLIAWLRSKDVKNVTLTGGEPLLVPGIRHLIEELGREGKNVEIETNGSVDISPFHALPHRPAFTLDYKCPDSGMEDFMLTDNYALLDAKDTVKFVAGSETDLDKAFEICSRYHLSDRCHVYLSAVFGKITPAQIVSYMMDHHWNEACLQLQLHKYIWPGEQRGV